jgi:TonB family protein
MRAVVVVLGIAACGGAGAPARVVDEPVGDRDAPVRTVDDDEPDDGVEVVSSRGRMDPADIEAGIAPMAAVLEDCFLSRVAKQKFLGGRVELRWEIAQDGAVTSAQVAWSDLGSWGVEKCLLDAARATTFAPPRGGAADFTVPLEFSPRKAPGIWDGDQAAAVVARRAGDLAACAATAPDPTDVTVTLYVGTRGKVQSAGFASPALIDDAWAACAHGVATGWTLSDPRGVVIKIGFLYRPGETPAP